jgi:hypothetical protein
MKYLVLSILVLFSRVVTSNAQYVYTIKADSVKITNCDSSELIIENHTRAVPGFLYNTGNGRTVFRRAVQQLNDSLYQIGADTLTVPKSSYFWSLTGNYGTNPAYQFIGTTDCSPLGFRTCSVEQMRLFANGNFAINTAGSDNGYKLQVNGGISTSPGASVIGTLGFMTGSNVNGLGVQAGFRLDGGYSSLIFQGCGSGWAADMFTFATNFGNVPKVMYNVDGSIIRIQSGFNQANVGGLSGNVLFINPTYGALSNSAPMILRGIYYNPVIDSLIPGGRHIAIETVSGDVVLGTTSGNTGIGTNLPTAQLHTTGSVRFAGLTSDNTQTRILVSDTSGNLFYRDASTLAVNDILRSSLAVNGTITAKQLRLRPTDWPDYVFDSAYKLASLPAIENYIRQQHHLPGIPSAQEVRSDGTDVGDNQAALLKKIEELTLYDISQQKELNDEHKKLDLQAKELEVLKQEVSELRKLIVGQTKN